MTRPTRRSVLAACGAGTAALAGCAGIDVSLGDEGEREYDPAALAGLVDEGDPTAPDAFPVRVPEGMVERHYGRARDLLAGVPERPDVPNGAVAQELRERRGRVVEDLEEPPDAPTRLERLEDARRVRGAAAEVDGAYRAAVGEIDREAVAERRTSLRADLHAFEGEWDYRGDDPATALVVHAELEELRGTARRNAEAWPPFPADPGTEVFRAGEVLADVEEGRAALGDADRLRTRYVEGTTARSHRTAVETAAGRLDFRASWRRRRVHEFIDIRATDAFERSVEGTPAEYLYREARHRVRGAADRAGEARRTGDHATATLRSGTELAGLRAFEAVVDAVEAGEYGPPEDAARVATARKEAVAALREAHETEPVPASAELTRPARDSLQDARYRLENANGGARAVDRAYANLAYTGIYAGHLPDVVGTVMDVLRTDQ